MVRLLAVCVLLLVAKPAGAQEPPSSWSSTFVPAAVASQVPAGEPAILVAGGGERSDSLAGATSALATALRASGKVKLVMDASVLGDVSTLDDASLVAKAKPYPVTHVAIVRVFPGGEGQSSRVIVTLFSKEGEVVTAISGQEGVALASTAEPASASLGVSTAAMDSVEGVSDVARVEGKAARRAKLDQYDREKMVIQEGVQLEGDTARAGDWPRPYLGKYLKPLDERAFYKHAGRPDLVRSYDGVRSRRAVVAATSLGIAVAGGGIAWLINDWQSGRCEEEMLLDPDKHCAGAGATAKNVGGLVVITGLAVAILTVGTTPARLTSPSQAREIADRHNRALRDKLGLGEEVARRDTPTYFHLTPHVGPKSGGLTLALDF